MAKSVGRAIRELREEAGISRAALARAAGLDPAAVSHIEKGDRPQLRFTTACQLAKALGVSTDELASRAGLIKGKGSGARPDAKRAALLAGAQGAQSLLERAIRQIERLTRIASDS